MEAELRSSSFVWIFMIAREDKRCRATRRSAAHAAARLGKCVLGDGGTIAADLARSNFDSAITEHEAGDDVEETQKSG